MMALTNQGGKWCDAGNVGMMFRAQYDSSSSTFDTVAFGQKLNIHSSL